MYFSTITPNPIFFVGSTVSQTQVTIEFSSAAIAFFYRTFKKNATIGVSSLGVGAHGSVAMCWRWYYSRLV
jgi:hypothetical protein